DHRFDVGGAGVGIGVVRDQAISDPVRDGVAPGAVLVREDRGHHMIDLGFVVGSGGGAVIETGGTEGRIVLEDDLGAALRIGVAGIAGAAIVSPEVEVGLVAIVDSPTREGAGDLNDVVLRVI